MIPKPYPGSTPPSVSTCAQEEADLLMYLHRELPTVAHFRVKRHLSHCASCRTRLASLTVASEALADTFRGSTLPRWSPRPEPVLPAALSGGTISLLVVLAGLFLILTGAMVVRQGQARTAAPMTQPPPPPEYDMVLCPETGELKPVGPVVSGSKPKAENTHDNTQKASEAQEPKKTGEKPSQESHENAPTSAALEDPEHCR
ncbi:MAG: hypothetical protein OHK0029_13180 [Armatimonadaceae bacterium]